MLLADLGADVIKIEAQGKGDDSRYFSPIKNCESGYFMYLNRNKRSVSINLKTDKGKKIIYGLAKSTDVIVENFSPGTMAKLDLGYDIIKKFNPEVIYASISGFGQSGPYRNKVAYDGVAQAMGGLASLTGQPDGVPVKAGPAISDATSGVHTALAIMAALYYRHQSGKGQYIDVAMMDTVFSMLENAVSMRTLLGVSPSRIGNANPASAPYNMYKSKDSYIVIATANDSLFAKLCGAMGRPELCTDPRFDSNPKRKLHEKDIDALVTEWTLRHTSAAIEAILDEAGVPVAMVKTIDQLVQDPHLKHRNMLIEVDHPIVGPVIYPGNPLKLEETPPQTLRRAPLLGEHNEEILKSVLHYSDKEIEVLREEKVI
jgi:CoA:oxalate CoA-transferase